MKKGVQLLFSATLVVFLTACSGGNSPESVAEQYLKHLANGDIDKAAKLGTDDTKQLLAMIGGLMGDQKPEEAAEVKDVKCDVDENGESAVCTYCCNDQGESDKVELTKVKGKWLVDMKKETPDFDDASFDMDFDDSFDQDDVEINEEETQE